MVYFLPFPVLSLISADNYVYAQELHPVMALLMLALLCSLHTQAYNAFNIAFM